MLYVFYILFWIAFSVLLLLLNFVSKTEVL